MVTQDFLQGHSTEFWRADSISTQCTLSCFNKGGEEKLEKEMTSDSTPIMIQSTGGSPLTNQRVGQLTVDTGFGLPPPISTCFPFIGTLIKAFRRQCTRCDLDHTEPS